MSRKAAPAFRLTLDVNVEMTEFATWKPERIAAFWAGIAQVLSAKAAVATVKAPVVPENAAQYSITDDRIAPVPFQHPDASVNKPIPELAGFVPSAVANGVPSGKTDTNAVKRI